MKNSLINKIKKGVDTAWRKGKKVTPALPLAAGLYFGAPANAEAQRKKFPDKHDYNARLVIDNGESKYSLEEKTLYNERFYFHRTDPESEDELGLAALDVNTSQTILDAESKDIEEVRADKEFKYRKVKLDNNEYANKIKLKDVRVSGWCEDQIKQKAGISKNKQTYITQTDLTDLIPDLKTIVLGDNREFYFPHVAEGQKDKEGKTNHYLIPKKGAKIAINYADKSLTIIGDIYRGYLEDEPVVIKKSSGTAVEISREEVPQKEQEKEKTSTSKTKKNFYLIAGVNGNDKFWEGNLGIQFGPIALIGNYGKAKDENIKQITTDVSPNTGRYGYGTEDNTDISVLGANAELHFFSNKKVSPFIGGGINNWNYTTKFNEQIRDANDNVIKGNTNSKTNSEVSYKGNAGLNFKLGEKSKIGLQAGYDTKAKFHGGVRFTRKF